MHRIFSPVAINFFAPAYSISYSIKNAFFSFFPYFETKRALIAENERLRTAVLNIESLQKRNEYLEQELSKVLGSAHEQSLENYISARVIRAPDASPYDTFVLNKGEMEEIREGAKVFALNGVPIGVISKVYFVTSIAKLLGTPGESYLASVGENKVQGTAVGRGAGNFEIIFPHGVNVINGDEVYLPEISELPFSKIEDVRETEGGTFVRVLFKAPYALFNTDEVMIHR